MKTNIKDLTIEWKHLDRDGRTCDRCGDTGLAVREAVNKLVRRCSPKGVVVRFQETRLTPERIRQSNVILFNGVPLEKVLANTSVEQNRCGSCSDLMGMETHCRTVSQGGEVYEAIPEGLILKAACRVLGCYCRHE